MTREEAEQGLLDAEAENTLLFCPLINAKCVTNCVCYMKGYVHKSPGGIYKVYKSNCTNSMFFWRVK